MTQPDTTHATPVYIPVDIAVRSHALAWAVSAYQPRFPDVGADVPAEILATAVKFESWILRGDA